MWIQILIKMEIKVYLNRKADKPVFCRIVPTNDALSIDYQTLARAMYILFGNDCVIEFRLV